MPVSKYSTTCVVCGELLQNSSGDYGRQTCGSAHCRAVLMLTPVVADPAKQRHQEPGYERNKPPPRNSESVYRRVVEYIRTLTIEAGDEEVHRQQAVWFDVDSSDWAFGDEHITADVRGIGNVDHRELWSFLSRVRVCFRARTRDAKVWLHVQRKEGESTADAVRRGLMNNSGWEDMYDVFLAWRCRCDAGSEWIVDRLDDLPDEPGPHHNCPICGATPLYVEVVL
jgi:hypothetical protein